MKEYEKVLGEKLGEKKYKSEKSTNNELDIYTEILHLTKK